MSEKRASSLSPHKLTMPPSRPMMIRRRSQWSVPCSETETEHRGRSVNVATYLNANDDEYTSSSGITSELESEDESEESIREDGVLLQADDGTLDDEAYSRGSSLSETGTTDTTNESMSDIHCRSSSWEGSPALRQSSTNTVSTSTNPQDFKYQAPLGNRTSSIIKEVKAAALNTSRKQYSESLAPPVLYFRGAYKMTTN